VSIAACNILTLSALARQFKATLIGKDHLIHRMTDGVEKMADMLDPHSRQRTPKNGLLGARRPNESIPNGKALNNDTPATALTNGPANSTASLFDNMDPNAFDFNDPTLGLGMPFFDFEGTTLNPGDAVWNFQA